MEIIFDTREINSESDFYNLLSKQHSGFCDYFGCNIDAFRDYVGLLEGDTLVFLNYDLGRIKMDNFYTKIINIINEWNAILDKAKVDKERMIKIIM